MSTEQVSEVASVGRGRTNGLPWRVLAAGALIAAGAWAYLANTTGRPAMDMNMRVTSGSTPVPVTVAEVARGRMTGSVVYTGSVAAYNEEDIFPRVTGRIVEMSVYPGDAVRPGQVVARLDDVELSSRAREAASGAAAAAASVAQMEADVTAARHGIAQMERELAMAQAEGVAARDAVVQMEKELAMTEADAGYQEQVGAREERLFQSGAVSRQDVESARAMVTAARARVAAGRARVAQMQAMAVAAQAKIEAARAKLDQARAMEASALRRREAMAAMAAQGQAMQRTAETVRDYARIEAPSAGYVVKRLVAPGVLVQPGMAILKIAQIDRVRLQANVGEKDVASIRVGSPVTVTTATGAGASARVSSVFPFVDPGARTAVVEAVVDNPGRRLLPGQYVQMEFVTGERDQALTVPASAVARLGGTARVWMVVADRAEARSVTTGLQGRDRVEIVEGLTGTERVIVRGHEGLYAGAPVRDVAGAASPGGHAGHGAAGPAAAPPAAPPAGHGTHGTPAPAGPAKKEDGHAGH